MICALPEGIASLIRGAETTNPSRTIATWFKGDSRVVTRLVIAPKAFVPSPLKDRDTYQAKP